jgi:hypothetical protein
MIETIHQTYSGMGITEMKSHVTLLEKAEKTESTFLRKLLRSLHYPCEPGLQSQIVFLIRSILLFPDAQTPEAALFLTQTPTSNLSDIWRMFHENHVDTIISLLVRPPNCALDDMQLQLAQHYIIDILKSMVNNHDFVMKRTVLKNDVLKKVSDLITIPEHKNQPITDVQLRLSCMRFFRACITKNEPYFKKRIISHHILDSAVDLFCHAKRSSNLLNSCFLSILHPLFHKDTRSKYPELVEYIVARYFPRLQKVEPSMFNKLRQDYEDYLKEKSKEPDPKPPNEAKPTASDDDKESEEASPADPIQNEPEKENMLSVPPAFDRKRRRSESPMDYASMPKKRKISQENLSVP